MYMYIYVHIPLYINYTDVSMRYIYIKPCVCTDFICKNIYYYFW